MAATFESTGQVGVGGLSRILSSVKGRDGRIGNQGSSLDLHTRLLKPADRALNRRREIDTKSVQRITRELPMRTKASGISSGIPKVVRDGYTSTLKENQA